MTQSDQPRRDDYVGTGSLTDFVYTFEINNKTQIDVVLIDVDVNSVVTRFPQVLDDDYEVQGVGDSGGGTIVFAVPPVSGIFIVLEGNVPFDQNTVFIEGNPLPAKSLENALDKLTQQVQQLRDRINATLRTPTLPDFVDGQLPDGVAALDILQINETLDGFTSNSISAVFDSGALTAHQLDQLDNIGDTTTIITSQWDFLGLMDQGVATSDAVTFASVNGASNLSDLAALTSAEIAQLANINGTAISAANWSFVPSLNQDLGTTDTPEFADITIGGEPVGNTTIHANQNFNSGSIENGLLSIASATEFNISAGSGIVVDYSTDLLDPDTIEVSWTTFSTVTLAGIGSNNFKSIAIDGAGAIVQKDGKFTELELRDLIIIGEILHNATDILSVIDAPRKAIGRPDIVTDLLTTIGTLNRSGNLFSANGVNLNIDKTAGESFGLSINSNNSEKLANITTDASAVAGSFIPIHRDGSGGWTILAATTTVDVGNYDDGSGSLASLTSNQATNHRLAFEAETGNIYFLYGQTQYSTLTQATDAVPDGFNVIDVIFAALDVRAILSSRGGATDLSLVTDAVFTEVSKLGVTSGATTSIQAASLQTAYDQSPAIVLDAATPIDIEVNTDTDDILIGRDGSSTETFSLDGLGNIVSSGDTILDGKLTLAGLLNAGVQLKMTANTAQGSNIMMDIQDFATNPIFGLYENRTQLDKLLKVDANQEINNVDVNEEALHITSAAGQVSKVFKIDDNSGTELLSLDDAGQFLILGAELESGGGETVLHYASFDELSTTNTVRIPIPADPEIVSIKIEIRDIRMGVPAGSVKDGLMLRFSTDANPGVSKAPATNYVQRTTTDGTSRVFETSQGIDFSPFAAAVLLTNVTQSFDVHIFSLRSDLVDEVPIGVTGWTRTGPASDALKNVAVSGVFKPANAGENAEVLFDLEILNSFNGIPNWTSGNIKVIGIKSGGPSF